MSTMVAQREPSSRTFTVMPEGLDLAADVNPIARMNGLKVPVGHVLLPDQSGVSEFKVSRNPGLPEQIDSRHQVYFADLTIGDEEPFPVAIKTYKKNNGAENWRREVAAYEIAKRARLDTLTPVMIANFGGGVLMATRYDAELFDLERRYRGMAPEGYGIDECTLLSTAASALAALHNSDVVHGDMAPRNIALRRKDAQHPVLTDPETFRFPGELDLASLAKGKELDLQHLIDESAAIIARREGGVKGVYSRAANEIKERVEGKVVPVYRSGLGHSFQTVS